MDAIDTHLATYPESPVILDLFGTHDADAIRAKARELDPDAGEVFFFGASVGALFGIRRRDGSRVAMKLHKLYRDEQFLDDMQSVQGALADAGFAAPRPLGRRGLVTFEEWIDRGTYRDGHEPPVRRAVAAALADLVSLASASGVRPQRPFFPLRDDGLWPVPHNALFDFEATAAGAEWIDEVARKAQKERDTPVGREVVGHTDWGVKHMRFDHELRPTVVYDWDSVQTDTEPRIVGNAMVNFTYQPELDVTPSASVEEALAFLADYEEACGEPFTEEERRSARGAAVYLAAYGARCRWAYARTADRAYLEGLAGALL